MVGIVRYHGLLGLMRFCPDPEHVIGIQVSQAAGEAMFSSVGLAILTTYLPSNRRGKALGIVATAQGLGLAAGNALGGFITSHIIWRGIFLVNVPVAAVTLFYSMKILPGKQRRQTRAFRYARDSPYISHALDAPLRFEHTGED